jgi:hypothetical protein
MTTLHLGVTEMPYAHGGKTTGDVAEILEDKYHLFEHFWQAHQAAIVDKMSSAIVGSFESIMMGAAPPTDPHAAAMTEVQKMFNVFLDQREMDSLGYPGIPTAAAQAGISHRFKNAGNTSYQMAVGKDGKRHKIKWRSKQRGARPSFVDTGLLENSMRAWTTE